MIIPLAIITSRFRCLGYNVLPNIGRITTEFALSGFKDPAKRISSMLNVMADTFNPIGNAGMSLQTIAATVIDPLAALSKTRTGPENRSSA